MLKKDILGDAVADWYFNQSDAGLWIESDIAEKECIPVEYYFRSFEQMPGLEKEALGWCRGKILDIGAGAGSHALWLQENDRQVDAIDISPGCVKVMKERGVKNPKVADIRKFDGGKYDTLLLLMNGMGLAGSLENLPGFLKKIRSLLQPGGRIIFDSSDVRHLFMEEDGSMLIDLNAPYYGEMKFRFQYRGETGEWFNWLYIDEILLEQYALEQGLNTEIIYREENGHYLGLLTCG